MPAGEHSDWAAEYGAFKGFCLVIGTDQGLQATVMPSDRFVVSTLVSDEGGQPDSSPKLLWQTKCAWQKPSLLAAARDKNEFFRDCAGVACQFVAGAGVSGGMEIHITAMDLPWQRACQIFGGRVHPCGGGLQPGLSTWKVSSANPMELAYQGETHRKRVRADGPGLHFDGKMPVS